MQPAELTELTKVERTGPGSLTISRDDDHDVELLALLAKRNMKAICSMPGHLKMIRNIRLESLRFRCYFWAANPKQVHGNL